MISFLCFYSSTPGLYNGLCWKVADVLLSHTYREIWIWRWEARADFAVAFQDASAGANTDDERNAYVLFGGRGEGAVSLRICEREERQQSYTEQTAKDESQCIFTNPRETSRHCPRCEACDTTFITSAALANSLGANSDSSPSVVEDVPTVSDNLPYYNCFDAELPLEVELDDEELAALLGIPMAGSVLEIERRHRGVWSDNFGPL